MNESELLEGLKAGREDIFVHIFNENWENLFREAFYRLSDRTEAQDIVQDIFTDFWQRRYELHISSTISAYLYGALKYSIIRHVSRAKLHQNIIDHLVHQMSDMEDNILDVIAVSEIQKTIEESIALFPENMREIFLLRAKEFTIQEISEALGLSAQTVKNNTSDALKRLKKVLIEKHPEVSSSLSTLLLLFIKN